MDNQCLENILEEIYQEGMTYFKNNNIIGAQQKFMEILTLDPDGNTKNYLNISFNELASKNLEAIKSSGGNSTIIKI